MVILRKPFTRISMNLRCSTMNSVLLEAASSRRFIKYVHTVNTATMTPVRNRQFVFNHTSMPGRRNVFVDKHPFSERQVSLYGTRCDSKSNHNDDTVNDRSGCKKLCKLEQRSVCYEDDDLG